MKTLRIFFLFIITSFFILPSSAFSGYTGTWTDSHGVNHTSEPDYGSSSSSGRGNWGSSRPKPPPVNDGGIKAARSAAKFTLKESKRYFKKGDWKLAIHNATRCLANDVRNVKALHLRATALDKWNQEIAEEKGIEEFNFKNLNDLINEYEVALSWGPKNRKSKKRLMELKSILEEKNKTADRIDQRDKAYNEGLAFVREKRWDEALEAYRCAISWDYSDHGAHGQIGWLLEKRMDYKDARNAYLKAVSYGSKNPKIFSKLANMHSHFEDYEKAVHTAKRGLVLDGNLASLHHQLGYALEQLYRYDESEEPIRKALELKPENQYYMSDMINLLVRQSKIEEAEMMLESLKQLYPDGSNTSYYIQRIGIIREEQREKAMAEQAAIEASSSETEGELNHLVQDETPQNVALQTSTATLGMKKNTGFAADMTGQTTIDQEGKESVGEQLKSVNFHSNYALKRNSDEGAKSEASIGFDNEGSDQGEIKPLDLTGVPAYEHDPQIPKEHRTPEVVELVKKRTEIRTKRIQREKELVTLQESTEKDVVLIAKIKMEISNIENEEHFLNFSITEKILRSSSKVENMPNMEVSLGN